ncbi:MAG: CBS domain-containing protein [Pseudomonadales bacterium]|nr:CBS domain-containing protein [Pseudomonadales bacterium]
MSNQLQVKNYMQKAITVVQSATVSEAAQVILEHKLSGVTVVDDAGDLKGILSELDCLRAIVNAVYNGSLPGAAIVEDIMTKRVESNSPEDNIVTVAASMLDHKHRRRPVVENGKLVGQVSCRQILKAIKDFKTT